MNPISRRQFVRHASSGAVVATAYRLSSQYLCAQPTPAHAPAPSSLFEPLDFKPVPPGFDDRVVVPEGFSAQVLVSRDTPINPRGDRFGDDNDFICLLQRTEREGWLWVNHESTDVFLIEQAPVPPHRVNKALIANYLEAMGGSCIRVTRSDAGRWRPVLPDPKNFRLSGMTPGIEFTGPARGSSWLGKATTCVGSVANCGGGITPWGTVLSAEENVYAVFGDPEMGDPGTSANKFFDRKPEHYGYVVEIDPESGRFWKHTALGRFAHENIVFAVAKDGRLVGYMGDDRARQCIYKYVSKDRYRPELGAENRQLLIDGTLHVADTNRGRWIPLDPSTQSSLRSAGFDRARVCVQTRTAAMYCGGTPHGRPEGISRNPVSGEVFISLSAHPVSGAQRTADTPNDLAGAIARIREADNDPGAVEFHFDLALMAGREVGLAWPDNLTFVNDRDLMVCTDYKGAHPSLPHSTHARMGNNQLMVTATRGPDTGKVLRFATAPREAEFASPFLTPERDELWVSVQHPGEGSTDPNALISHWPDGGKSWPRSSVIAIARTAR